MKFTKMQGAGNDYVYVNCFVEQIEDPAAAAIKVSNRNFGISADADIDVGTAPRTGIGGTAATGGDPERLHGDSGGCSYSPLLQRDR